jgi:hypothetical protein
VELQVLKSNLKGLTKKERRMPTAQELLARAPRIPQPRMNLKSSLQVLQLKMARRS